MSLSFLRHKIERAVELPVTLPKNGRVRNDSYFRNNNSRKISTPIIIHEFSFVFFLSFVRGPLSIKRRLPVDIMVNRK